MDNLEEMEEFLNIYNLPKLSQESVNAKNKERKGSELETIIKTLPMNLMVSLYQ